MSQHSACCLPWCVSSSGFMKICPISWYSRLQGLVQGLVEKVNSLNVYCIHKFVSESVLSRVRLCLNQMFSLCVWAGEWFVMKWDPIKPRLISNSKARVALALNSCFFFFFLATPSECWNYEHVSPVFLMPPIMMVTFKRHHATT